MRAVRGMLRKVVSVGIVIAIMAAPMADLTWADENRWGFGTDIGFWSGTTNGTVFTLGFNLDYYLDRSFSFGPMMLLVPTGDLTQIAFAGVAKYHLRLNNGINIVPFAGIGLVHADLDRGAGPNRIDRNDTSHFIPLGVSAEYQATRNIALATTLMVNLHHITLSPPVENDNTSVAVMFGIRFGP